MGLVLYYAPWSTATSSVWALKELDVPCELRKVDLQKKETQTSEYLALNPNGKVPLLLHDGVPIFESVAILAHLGETYGADKKLYPPPGIERAQALQWLVWTNVTLGGSTATYYSNTSEMIPAELRNAAAAEAANAAIKGHLTIVDKHLAGKTWLVGEHFTLSDLHLASMLGWLAGIGFSFEEWSNLHRWHKSALARPAGIAAMSA